MTMTKARKIVLGLSLAATTLAGAAYAQQAAKNDGIVTRAEAQAKAQEMFARLDANHDGKLDQADREARRAERRNAAFDRLDADHNGQISRAEFDAPPPRGPEGMGPDHGPGPMPGGPDGHRWGGPGKHGWGGRGMHRGGGEMGGGMMMGRMADANKDGAITQAEFVQAAMQRFDAADANHDGKVTREERQAAFKAMRERMRSEWQSRGAAPAAPSATPAS